MMFATVYPHYHPKKGQPTNFIQKIWANPHVIPINADLLGFPEDRNAFLAKGHTIRAGNRWKVGDYFKPLVWSGKPYRSKTIQIASPIMVEKTWQFIIGLVLIARRAQPITSHIYEQIDFKLFAPLPVDKKLENFGWYHNRIVLVDYADTRYMCSDCELLFKEKSPNQ